MSNPAPPPTLARLFHNRWALPILAALARSGGSRFANLAHGLGVGRESLRRTLAALSEAGLVRRNPGYGHPLRPEYVLSGQGGRVAPLCTTLLDALRERGLDQVARKKWPLPILFALHEGPSRFSELRAALEGVTGRALALGLRELVDAGLVQRSVTDTYPPATSYRLADDARPLAELVATLARELGR